MRDLVPTAIDFNALIEDVRKQRQQELKGSVELSQITAHKLFNLLQTEPWCDIKDFNSRCLIIDTRPSAAYSESHLRAAQNITSVDQLRDSKLLSSEGIDALDIRYDVIVYGEQNDAVDHQEIVNVIQKRPDRVRLLFSLKSAYSSFSTSYPCLCLSSEDEKTKRQHEVWIRLPTEILQGRLYVVHRDTRSMISSLAIRSLSIDFIVDVSTRPMVAAAADTSDDDDRERRRPPRYISICPDPLLHVDPGSVSSIPITIDNEVLHNVVDELSRRINIEGTKTVVFSTDSSSVAAACVIAFLMKHKNWGLNTCLACIMYHGLTPNWTSSQLQVLRAFRHDAATEASTSTSTALIPAATSSSSSSSSSSSF